MTQTSSCSAIDIIKKRCQVLGKDFDKATCRIKNKNDTTRKRVYCTQAGDVDSTMTFVRAKEGSSELVLIPNNLEVVFQTEKAVFASRVQYFRPNDCQYPTCRMYEVVPINEDGIVEPNYRRYHHETQTAALKEAIDRKYSEAASSKVKRPNGRVCFGVYKRSVQDHLRQEFSKRELPTDSTVKELFLQWLHEGDYYHYSEHLAQDSNLPEQFSPAVSEPSATDVNVGNPKLFYHFSDPFIPLLKDETKEQNEFVSSPTSKKRKFPEDNFFFDSIIDQVFEMVDHNKDGYLELSEIVSHWTWNRPQYLGSYVEPFARSVIKAYSATPDGTSISLQDFRRFMLGRCHQINNTFKDIDVDNDGYISAEELVAAGLGGDWQLLCSEDVENLMNWLDHSENATRISKKRFFLALLLLPPHCDLRHLVNLLRSWNSSSGNKNKKLNDSQGPFCGIFDEVDQMLELPDSPVTVL